MKHDLKKIVRNEIERIGVEAASRAFGVSVGTISNWVSGKTAPSITALEVVMDGQAPERTLNPEASDIVMWEGRKVMILLPVYRSFCPDTHYTLFANYAKYGPEKIGMLIEKRTVIHESRNILVHKALKTDAEDFIFFDDDMLLPCGSVDLFNGRYRAGVPDRCAMHNAISRLMSHGPEHKIVGSLYFGRHELGRAQCALGFESDAESANLRNHRTYTGLLPMRWIGTGGLKIHRSVFEDMRKAIDEGQFEECKPVNDSLWYGFFNPRRVGMGEDVSFGNRAYELGIPSYLDPELELLHMGESPFGSRNTRNP